MKTTTATRKLGRREGMTLLQEKFVKEYLVDLNASQAALRAGYRGTLPTLGAIGCTLLKNVNVAAAIQKAFQKRSQRTEVKADNVLLELAKIGFADMKDFVEWGEGGVKLVDSKKLAPGLTSVVGEVSQTKFKGEVTIKFKLHDKISALDKIARHLGMYKNDGADNSGGVMGAVALELFRRMLNDAHANVEVPKTIENSSVEEFRSGLNGKS